MKIQFFLVIVAATLAFAQKDENTSAAPTQSEANKPHATAEAVCGEATTQMEINQCFAAAYQRADKEINELYSNIMNKQAPPTGITYRRPSAPGSNTATQAVKRQQRSTRVDPFSRQFERNA